ncbi:MAG: glutathione S-transferase family protein [Pseudomonadales bacterium]|jgi:glutathione S-transferase|nr:glutathione S-transferase family protein [Pseudomonadales bacterium]
MSEPELYLFPISHYCEKARWALDHHRIAHRVRDLAPGPHRAIVRRLGAPASSVPVLCAAGEVIQGSSAIVDWADARCADPARFLTPPELAAEARALEARLDARLGVEVRRHAYSVMLFEAPGEIRRRFAAAVDLRQATVVRLIWPVLRRSMIRGMDLGPAQRLEAREAVSEELDWLDEQLVDGRPFLLGERFTRADLAAASLLSPILRPPERPGRMQSALPPAMAADLADWAARPSIAWARSVYRSHRLPSTAP